MREKLIELIKQVDERCDATSCMKCEYRGKGLSCGRYMLADYLIKNGVKIPTMCKNCKDYRPVISNGEPMHYGICVNTHDNVPWAILRHRYEGDSCSYGIPKESEE